MNVPEGFERFIRWVMRDVTYCRTYSAVVVRDNGDGTVDLLPDDPEMPSSLGLQRVRVAVGIAGASVIAKPGARCLFGFDDGDPRAPVVTEWAYARDSATISFGDDSSGVARYGDLVKVLVDPALPVTGMAGGIQDVPNPSPPPLTIPVPWPPTTPFAGVANIVGPVHGVIQAGAAKVWG